MSIFKCKMCGGALEIAPNTTIIECEYCGTHQTLPKLDDEKREKMYDRANHFRRSNEFDKAMGVYEQILIEDDTDAEAYWSLVLCRYGIEYVEDPSTHKHIPTVNRVQFTSIFDDDNYKSALQYADSLQRHLYEEEAKAINEIQKGILAISQKEEPFDVFICYKESDSQGRRTRDSVLAQELYYQLKQEGFKVFFSRITLEDKLGSAYEPYIFAALNSAKVMVVLGTKPEYFNAVWVRNEWSRYLALIKQGQKKMLIPAYRDMDPYDLPEEFSHLQAQDMSKLGFMQDLIRGIKKIVKAYDPKGTVVTAATTSNTSPLLKRAFMFLEDGEFDRADEFCENVLNQDPENAHAYLGKLMAELRINKIEDLKNLTQPLDSNKNFQKALRFADDNLKTELKSYAKYANESARLKHIQHLANALAIHRSAQLKRTYRLAKSTMNSATTVIEYQEAAQLFQSISGYMDADLLACDCLTQAQKVREFTIAEQERKAEANRIAEQERIAAQALAAEQERIKEAQRQAKAAQYAEERRLADEAILAENKIIAQKNKISRKFILFAVLTGIVLIVIGAISEFMYGLIMPMEGYSPLFNAFMDVFSYFVVIVPVAILPNAFALLSILLSHKAKKAKIILSILAFITTAPVVLLTLVFLLALVVAFDPEVLGIIGAFCIAGLLDICACIYLIALPIIIKKKIS